MLNVTKIEAGWYKIEASGRTFRAIRGDIHCGYQDRDWVLAELDERGEQMEHFGNVATLRDAKDWVRHGVRKEEE